jgi:hypothetical protein
VLNALLAGTDLVSLLLFLGGYISNILPSFLIIASALFLMIFGARVVIIYSYQNKIGKCVFFLTLGGTIGFFGELYNVMTLYAGEGVKPFALDDFFYIPALISMGIGFHYAVQGNKIKWTVNKIRAMIAWAFILFLLLVVVFYIAVTKELVASDISIIYLILTSALSISALRVLMATWEYLGGLIFKAWFSIFIGICLLIVTIVALFMTVGSSAENSNLSYIPLCLLAASEACLAYGFAVLGTISKNIKERVINQI